jgi:hypothetical protein
MCEQEAAMSYSTTYWVLESDEERALILIGSAPLH